MLFNAVWHCRTDAVPVLTAQRAVRCAYLSQKIPVYFSDLTGL